MTDVTGPSTSAAPRALSGLLSVILGARHIVVVSRDTTATAMELPWSPDDAEAMASALRARLGAVTGFVVTVGSALLEIAEPELPPLNPADARTLLWREADRYFPIDEPVAVTLVDRVAFAVASRRMNAWIRALQTIAPVRSIVTAAQVAAGATGTGTAHVFIAGTLDGVVESRDGRVVTIRRSVISGRATDTTRTERDAAKALDATALGRAAIAWAAAPLSIQLLDVTLAGQFRRATQRRWATAAVALVGAIVMVLWSADTRQRRVLEALTARAAQLQNDAAPAERALFRLDRARVELDALTAARARQASLNNPMHVLEQLGRVLPRDAFLQRLEWDGTGWRVEGTADQAPRLIPLLDGDAHFADVRIAAPSQRFLEAGRQRESFAIGFRMRAATPGASHGAP